jgi:hypothetical protein
LVGNKIRARAGAGIAQAAADDLFHAAFVQIDARSKHGSTLR